MHPNKILIYIARFVILVLIQGLVLNHMNIGGYLNPLLYIMFILLLPFDFSRPWSLVLAFFLGYFVDLFSGTPGMHAAATVFTAFLRPYFLNTIGKRDDEEIDVEPTIENLGLRKVLYFNVIMVVIHHLLFFYIEAFRLSEFFSILWRSVLSSILTIVFILLIQVLFFSRKKKRKL